MRQMIAVLALLLTASTALAIDPAKYPPRQTPQAQIDVWGRGVDIRTPVADVRVHPRPVLFPLLHRLFAPRVQIQVQPPRQGPPCSDCPRNAQPF